jgi:predicted aspartyl protease
MPIHPAFVPLLPVLLLMPAISAQQATQSVSDVDVIQTTTDANERMTVPVRLGNKGPFNFLIDTGSQNTVISTALANQLSLQPNARARLVGVAGEQTVSTVSIDQMDLGTRSYYSVRAPLLERSNIGADGILGLDSLQGQRVLIDFRKGVILVSDAKTLGGNQGFDIVVTARRRSGQLIMTDAKIDGVRVNVVIDTGAEYSIGNRALQDALRNRSPQGQAMLRSVTGQEILADLALARSLMIDDIQFSNVLVAYADSPPFKVLGLDKKPALFLGMRDMRSLQRIAIDFSTRRIYFDMPDGAFGK